MWSRIADWLDAQRQAHPWWFVIWMNVVGALGLIALNRAAP